MKSGLCLLFLFLAGSLTAADAPAPSLRTNAPISLTPKSADVLKNFQVERGFRLELVAASPLVSTPIAMAFDENGRLFVLEKTENANNPGGTSGRVRLLEDIDGDGVFDGSAVYADNLNNPTALICYGSGVFVATSGSIQYLKDTAFDGTADVHREIFKSLAEPTNGNGGQVIISGFTWGLDNRIHVTTAGRGGDVISSSSPVQSVILSGGNFSFDPRTFKLAVENGSGTTGLCFDNRGRAIVASRDQGLQMVMFDPRYAARNPVAQMPGALLNLTVATSVERQFAADSLAINHGAIFPADCMGNVFEADSTRGIVNRVRLREHDLEYTAESPTSPAGVGFLTTHGFQIAQILTSPEGALYVAGTSRPTVSTNKLPAKASPPQPAAGGYIFRVVPTNFKQPKIPQMTKATSEQLVLFLRHPNGWLRDTAARLLFERQDRSAAVPLIRLLYDLQAPPLSRMHALHALDGLRVTADGRAGSPLLEQHIIKALADPSDLVREHAVLLAERFITPNGAISDPLWNQLISLTANASPQVRYQLAFTLGQTQHAVRGEALAQIFRSDSASRWMQAALASSLDEGAADMLDALAGDASLRNNLGAGEFLRQLFYIIGAKNLPGEVGRALADLSKIPDSSLAFSSARAFDNGLQSADNSLAFVDNHNTLQPLYNNAAQVVLDTKADENVRIQALRLLSGVPSVDPGMTVGLLQVWPMLKPQMRREAVVALLSQPNRTAGMLQGMEGDWLSKFELTSAQIRTLFAPSPSSLVPGRVAVLYGKAPPNVSRQPVVDRFLPATQMAGRANSGHAVFLARCATCHQAGGEGNPLGEKLDGARGMDKNRLLIKIIDPNREPPTKYPMTLVETSAGETLTGFVVAESGKSITLCQANGDNRVIAHSNTVTRRSLGFSPMPEGLEAGLSQLDMADLLAYLGSQ